ncbi:hypothetical protein DIE18_04365 [Burkholderia sp. Bp9125]|nr:hypothetical protein DIE18_04365 [Burkholderia sp. Bp9125]
MSRPAFPAGTPACGVALPRILLHSDLHLETGPFTLPACDGPALAVFAGDVKPGVDSLAALQRITALPAVFIAGNHEFWGGDYFEVLEQLRTTPAGNVHFLENREVVLDGVRFLGATLWADYGGGNRALMDYGLWQMRDHRYIRAARWWTAANKSRFLATFGQHALEKFEGQFNPLLARELHARSVAWLRRALAKRFDGPTVVVTHHAPTYASLLKSGCVTEIALQPASWRHRMNDDLNLTMVGSYASDTLGQLGRQLESADVRLWAHGHLHAALSFGAHGVPVACNPRGRIHEPLTAESARTYAFWGMHLTEQDIARSQQHARDYPEDGDGRDYDKARTFALDDSGYDLVRESHAEVMDRLATLRHEARSLRAVARSRRAHLADLAGHRADTLRQQAVEAVRAFAREMLEQLGPTHREHVFQMGLHYALSACRLVPARPKRRASLAGLENVADYASLMTMREDPVRPEYAERYSAANHVKHVVRTLDLLWAALGRAPAACVKLKRDREQQRRLRNA